MKRGSLHDSETPQKQVVAMTLMNSMVSGSSTTPQLLAVLLVTWITALDARATADRLDHLLVVHAERTEAYLSGLRVSGWFRCLAVATAGVFALYGSKFGRWVFTMGVAYQAILPWRQFTDQFRSGFESRRGSRPPGLAAVAGVAWIAVSRGLPVLLIHRTLQQA